MSKFGSVPTVFRCREAVRGAGSTMLAVHLLIYEKEHWNGEGVVLFDDKENIMQIDIQWRM